MSVWSGSESAVRQLRFSRTRFPIVIYDSRVTVTMKCEIKTDNTDIDTNDESGPVSFVVVGSER